MKRYGFVSELIPNLVVVLYFHRQGKSSSLSTCLGGKWYYLYTNNLRENEQLDKVTQNHLFSTIPISSGLYPKSFLCMTDEEAEAPQRSPHRMILSMPKLIFLCVFL